MVEFCVYWVNTKCKLNDLWWECAPSFRAARVWVLLQQGCKYQQHNAACRKERKGCYDIIIITCNFKSLLWVCKTLQPRPSCSSDVLLSWELFRSLMSSVSGSLIIPTVTQLNVCSFNFYHRPVRKHRGFFCLARLLAYLSIWCFVLLVCSSL